MAAVKVGVQGVRLACRGAGGMDGAAVRLQAVAKLPDITSLCVCVCGAFALFDWHGSCRGGPDCGENNC